jgi:hypothetical protein
MNYLIEGAIHQELLDDDVPLYSTFCFTNAKVTSPVSLAEFLDVVTEMVEEEKVALYEWESKEQVLRRLIVVPSDLLARYQGSGHEDSSWDPFGLYLSLEKRDGVVRPRPGTA